MGLFQKPWETKNERIALKWLDKTDDQELLMKAVRESPLCEIQIAAADKINDFELLKELAKQYDMRIVRRALSKIQDRGFLLEFAVNGKNNDDKCLSALSLFVGDEATVYEIAQHAKSRAVRAKALEMLTDETHIFEVLKRPGEMETPCLKAALKCIKDEKRRFEITVSTKNQELRNFGEQTLSDFELLTELARRKSYFTVKNKGILRNLTQQELYECCMHAYDGEKIRCILDEITDPELLWKIADDRDWHTSSYGVGIAEYAVAMIADEKIINEIALRVHAGYKVNEYSTAHNMLLKRVRDQDVLLKIAKNTNVGSILDIIALKLTDPKKQYDAALNGKSAWLFRDVVGMTDDAMLLAYIICREPVWSSFMGMSSDMEEELKITANQRLNMLPDNQAALAYIKEHKKD